MSPIASRILVTVALIAILGISGLWVMSNIWTCVTAPFDTKADPKELKSVYDDAKYADTRKKLEAELAKLRNELKVPDPDPPETDLRKK